MSIFGKNWKEDSDDEEINMHSHWKDDLKNNSPIIDDSKLNKAKLLLKDSLRELRKLNSGTHGLIFNIEQFLKEVDI